MQTTKATIPNAAGDDNPRSQNRQNHRQNRTQSRPGRPRSEAARTAVLEATWKLLHRETLGNISMTEIARRSGISKPTIYKWWPTKAALAAETFFTYTSLETPFPQGRSAAMRLRAQLESLVAFYNGDAGKIVRDIISHASSEAHSDTDTLKNFRERYLAKRRAEARTILTEGIQRGEFEHNLDCEMALDMLYGPIYYRLLIEHGPLDAQFAADLAQHVLDAIRCRK